MEKGRSMPVELGERGEEEQARWIQKVVPSQGLPGLWQRMRAGCSLIPRGGHSGMGSRGYQSGQPMCVWRDRGHGGCGGGHLQNAQSVDLRATYFPSSVY